MVSESSGDTGCRGLDLRHRTDLHRLLAADARSLMRIEYRIHVRRRRVLTGRCRKPGAVFSPRPIGEERIWAWQRPPNFDSVRAAGRERSGRNGIRLLDGRGDVTPARPGLCVEATP